MISVTLLLLVIATIFLVADAMGKMPSWTWGLCLILAELLHVLPLK